MHGASELILADGEQSTELLQQSLLCQLPDLQHTAPLGTDCHALTGGQQLLIWGQCDTQAIDGAVGLWGCPLQVTKPLLWRHTHTTAKLEWLLYLQSQKTSALVSIYLFRGPSIPSQDGREGGTAPHLQADAASAPFGSRLFLHSAGRITAVRDVLLTQGLAVCHDRLPVTYP